MMEIFEDPEVWTGGFFQMVIGLGEISAKSAEEFAALIWQYPPLDGPYRLDEGKAVDPMEFEEYGATDNCIATFPQGKIACRHFMMRFEDGTWESAFCFPMSSLGRIFPVAAYPFDDGTPTDWIAPVHDWLIGLAQRVFQAMPFEIAIIGFESEFPNEDGPIEVPTDIRYDGYLKRSGARLEWFPPTETDAPMKL
jgi:hypothetical protein